MMRKFLSADNLFIFIMSLLVLALNVAFIAAIYSAYLAGAYWMCVIFCLLQLVSIALPLFGWSIVNA
jgi:hypothetical protein